MFQLLTPSVVSWDAAISARGKKWQGAIGLLQEMVHHVLTPIVVSWSAAMSTCEKDDQWEKALGLLQEMGN